MPGSTRKGRFSDEPFGVRDIQFDHPRIFVEACTTSEKIRNFDGTRRLGWSDALPAVASVDVQNALKTSLVNASAADEKKERTPLLVPVFDYCCETTISEGAANESRGFDMGRKALGAQAASRSSAPISTAASASRDRAPRRRSRVAMSRVTRLIAASAFR